MTLLMLACADMAARVPREGPHTVIPSPPLPSPASQFLTTQPEVRPGLYCLVYRKSCFLGTDE